MEDQLDAFERAAHGLAVVNARAHEIHFAADLFEVLRIAGRQIVEDAHARARARGRLRDVRPDEARAARDQNDSR